MSLQAKGIKGEAIAKDIFWNANFNIQQVDWIIERNDKWYLSEIKYKALWHSTRSDFVGTGADIKQIQLRLKLSAKLNMDVVFINIVPKTGEVYWQLLSKLEQGQYETVHCPDGSTVRIYDINNFNKGTDGLNVQL